MKNVLLFLLGLALTAGGSAAGGPTTQGRPEQAGQGDPLMAVVKAVGTIEPEEVIDIGAQVPGTIQKFGPDAKSKTKTVDYGSFVKAGAVLAQLDRGPYEAAVAKARANLQQAEATLRLTAAKVVLAERELQRTKKRATGRTADAFDVEVAEAALDVARAAVAVKAAAVDQQKAALKEAAQNLDYTTIRSPVDGVIVDRRVNVGQTVAASLTAPSLFLVARDLQKLQVWTTVKEADIGRVAKGQSASFTVDARPKETFTGRVTQLRLNASLNNKDGVTYTVVIETENREGRLLPYLTARVSIEVGMRKERKK